jgi:hypothetical protein
MTYRGTVKGGVVVLEEGVRLPEGAAVQVELIEPRRSTLGDRLMKYSGRVKGLPTDMAENHDRYIHGRSRQ